MFQAGRRCLLSLICMGMMSSAFALSSNEAKQLATGETDTRIKTLAQLVSRADEGAYRLIKAMNDDAVKIAGDRILIIEDGKAIDAVSGEATNLPDSAEDVISNNRMRAELESAMAALRLLSKNPATRLEAAQALLKEPDAEKIPLLRKALASESE
nr:urea ABC transporter permease subunit UrtB [Oxalobacteraceae bacterium]